MSLECRLADKAEKRKSCVVLRQEQGVARMGRERVIGLVLSHGYAYYRRILRGIADFADRRPDWRFVSLAPEIGRPVRELLKNVDAAIMGICSREWCNLARRSRARIVNIDCVLPGPTIPRVGVDNRIIGRLAAQHFRERGLRSFAFVGHPQFLFSTEREDGFKSALKRSGHRVSVYQSSVQRSFDVTGCLPQLDARAKRWLASLPRPSGILAAGDALAADVLRVCAQIEIRVPEDLAILGVDDDDLYCEISRPRLSSVIVPSAALGVLAAKSAEQLMKSGRQFMARNRLVPPPGIAVRRSTDILAISDPDVVATIRFVRENCHRSISVADVLRVVPVSRRSLERRVSATLGITLGAEIRRTRLERARRLLMETDMSIAEVATQSGFTDFRHLAVAFRDAFGQTPTQHRRGVARQGS